MTNPWPPRCTRPLRTTGGPCRAFKMPWPRGTGIAAPPSCRRHLTDAERAALDKHEAEMKAWADEIVHGGPGAEEAAAAMVRSGFFAAAVGRPERRDPACWAWPAPESLTFRDEEQAIEFLGWWNYLCAICEHRTKLVCDHDHRTGLVRGYLCVSCNAREGHAGNDGVFAKYRQRNPASILGIRARYYSPITGYAVPELVAAGELEDSPVYKLAALLRRGGLTNQEGADS